jgi:hypothetical protein
VIDFGLLIILVIATEAVTEIIVASEFPLFLWFRNNLAQRAIPDTPRNDFKQQTTVAVYKLFSCGYCFSVWTAGFFALFTPELFYNQFVNWMCMTFLLHRLANWLHVIYELVRKGRVSTHDAELSVRVIMVEPDEDEDEDEDDNVGELVESLEKS